MKKDINPRITVSFRLRKSRHIRLKEETFQKNIGHCNVIEALVEKWLRGEVILLESDFKK